MLRRYRKRRCWARLSARRSAPARRSLRLWAESALGARAAGAEIALRVVGPVESRRLNQRFRGKDTPTNVLSFLSTAAAMSISGARHRPLGDLVICARLLKAEAMDQGKPLRAHWAHLVIHGALHLAGYDHQRVADARRMERREISVLRQLGFPNPYRSRGTP